MTHRKNDSLNDSILCANESFSRYGVALVIRIDKNIGLFCKRALQRDYIL